MRLLLHREASDVLADTFELYANAYERTILLGDFYGKETALFSMTTGSDKDKERARKGLKGVLEGVDGERRKRVLASLKSSLVTMYAVLSFHCLRSDLVLHSFNNPLKGAVTHAIVHRALWEYLVAINELEDETEREKSRREMFEKLKSPRYTIRSANDDRSCQDVLAEMVHTKDGSRVVREFIAQGSAKACHPCV
jgi:pumilio family protein 6